MKYAPIVLFVYNRPWHTQQTLESLQKNELAHESELYIYSDAPINAKHIQNVNMVRNYIKTIKGFKQITIIERDKNWGLADSIIDGVTEIVNKFGQIIVLEDDMVTSPFFLKYLNDGLKHYKNIKNVWHISGGNYPIEATDYNDTFLWRGMTCWGWGTWADRWQFFERNPQKLLKEFDAKMIKDFNLDGAQNFWKQVLNNVENKSKTWAIFWYASIFKAQGLCVNPYTSFVLNIGHDGSGSNSGSKDYYKTKLNNNANINFSTIIDEDKIALDKIKKFNSSISFLSKYKKKLLLWIYMVRAIFKNVF